MQELNIKTAYPFSYHIFAWPFQIHRTGGGGIGTPDGYVDALTAKFPSGGWRELKANTVFAENQKDRELLDRFMLWQYLSVAGQDIYEGVNPLARPDRTRRDICRILRLGGTGDGKYTIARDGKSYELRVEKVELHVYAFGCGVLFLYTENWLYPEIGDIQRIADYGRRIALPFLPRDEGGYIITADTLKLEFPEISVPPLDFRVLEGQYRKRAAEPRTRFLHDLVTADSVDIVPFTDDRMFEIELIRDDALSGLLTGDGLPPDTPKQDWRDNEDLKKKLYSLIYVDEGAPTCQDANMRDGLLAESIDPRWADWGTIHAATEFSMLCLTSRYGGIYDSVIRPFTVEYPYLVSLVLAQRTGLAGYSEAAGRLAGDDVSLFKWRRELIQLQKDFNVFRNQIMIPEVTNQDQGMEIYDLLRKQTRVLEQEELLDEQLEDLFDVADANFQTVLTWVALGFALLSPFVEGFFAPMMEGWGIIGGPPLFALLCLLTVFACHKSSRTEDWEKRAFDFFKKHGAFILACTGWALFLIALLSCFLNFTGKEEDSAPEQPPAQIEQYPQEANADETR